MHDLDVCRITRILCLVYLVVKLRSYIIKRCYNIWAILNFFQISALSIRTKVNNNSLVLRIITFYGSIWKSKQRTCSSCFPRRSDLSVTFLFFAFRIWCQIVTYVYFLKKLHTTNKSLHVFRGLVFMWKYPWRVLPACSKEGCESITHFRKLPYQNIKPTFFSSRKIWKSYILGGRGNY